VLVTRLDGRLHAIDDACGHAGRLLSEGRRSGASISCPGHGIAFDVRDGRCLTPGAACGAQRAYEVEERGGRLRLRLGP
jgi:nitrite reductase/ring-hydroxylating ferredoxin subunit